MSTHKHRRCDAEGFGARSKPTAIHRAWHTNATSRGYASDVVCRQETHNSSDKGVTTQATPPETGPERAANSYLNLERHNNNIYKGRLSTTTKFIQLLNQ